MPFPIRTLLTGKPNPVCIDPQETAAAAMDLMADKDYSQLPITRDGRALGVVTSESILRAIQRFQLYPEKFKVKDCRVKAREYGSEAELFDVIKGLEEIAAVLVVDPDRRILGIVTDYDASVYFHQRAKDIMLLEDIETDLKKMILLAFPNCATDSMEGVLASAISVASAPIREREQFKNALSRYIECVSGKLPTDDSAVDQAYGVLTGYSRRPKTFDDLTFKEYSIMLLSSDRWQTYSGVITMDKSGIDQMLTAVVEIRNKISHFRGEISPSERRDLESCRDWMASTLSELTESSKSISKALEEGASNPPANGAIHADHLALGQVAVEQHAQAALYCRAKGLTATGYPKGEKFIVKVCSEAAVEAAPSLIKHVRSVADLRTRLLRNRVMKQDGDRLVFVKDYEFGSPSTAAAVILGRSANGLIEWKTNAGQTLKGLRENADSTLEPALIAGAEVSPRMA